MKLLCVDDEQAFLQYLVKRLAGKNIEVFPALSGEEALSLAFKQKFDVAVIDLVLPGMDGVELKEKLNKIIPDLPCIFLAHEDQDQESHNGMSLIKKPVDMDSLFEAIESVQRNH